jgi:transcriptional regulator with XRE-family HTH domain
MSKEVDLFVGRKIRAKRKVIGLTLSDVAESLDKSTAQILQYEVGNTRVSAGTLYQLSVLFKVEISYFYEGYKEHKKKMQKQDNTLDKIENLDEAKKAKLISLLELL